MVSPLTVFTGAQDRAAQPLTSRVLARPTRDNLEWCLVLTPIVCATFLEKISVPPLGASGMGLFLPATIAAMIVGLLTRRLWFATARLAWFLATLSFIGLVQVTRFDHFSAPSLSVLFVLGFAYTLRSKTVSRADAQQAFQILALTIAVLGVVQFCAQFVLGQRYAFPIENFWPAAWRTQMFNNIVPVQWGSAIHKTNGLVMLEPSEFSQLCAIGLIVELSRPSRPAFLLVFAVALIVSYSGTGLLVLGAALPLALITSKRPNAICYAGFMFLIAAAFVAIFAEPLQLDVTLRRSHELAGPGSSGYARFIGWKELFNDQLWRDPLTILFGHGAGSEDGSGDMIYSKVTFEYGALGGLAYLAFVLYSLASSTAPLALRIAVGLSCVLMNGGYSAWGNGLALTLLVWPNNEGAGEKDAGIDLRGRSHRAT